MAHSHDNHLQDRVSVITGSSSGIGTATARALAVRGARVVLAARDADKLNSLVAETCGAGGTAAARFTDVTRLDDVEGLMEFAAGEYGPVDHLVNKAGLMLFSKSRPARHDHPSVRPHPQPQLGGRHPRRGRPRCLHRHQVRQGPQRGRHPPRPRGRRRRLRAQSAHRRHRQRHRHPPPPARTGEPPAAHGNGAPRTSNTASPLVRSP
ncbi:SDR family NAD(P)-dependent oxidoreductase [Streptomyces iakyrus]|uniref:SDR family NAD(P)-dependent oxidoreductase n=1 Tax=Streptomyces iakyrus TaxID=68219 RepID=UPI001FD7B2DF|nr:SDR family NAD(P)-dependent oxidoreductase [Streptomyces iakyrus]